MNKAMDRLNLKDVIICLDKDENEELVGIRIYHVDKAEVLNTIREIQKEGTVIYGEIKDSVTLNDMITIHGVYLHSRDSSRVFTKGVSGKDLFEKYSKNSFVPQPRVTCTLFKKKIIRDWKVLDDKVWTKGTRDITLPVDKTGISVMEYPKK